MMLCKEYKNMWPPCAGTSITTEADLKSNLSAFRRANLMS